MALIQQAITKQRSEKLINVQAGPGPNTEKKKSQQLYCTYNNHAWMWAQVTTNWLGSKVNKRNTCSSEQVRVLRLMRRKDSVKMA